MGVGWFPLKQVIGWAARRHGFIDPVTVLARLGAIAQPAEVEQPIELLRAGVILHARGLINARVIQHNLDWVWPWWVERQFDPRDRSFIPRAFSITHVNLTHRNWTALGVPGLSVFPLVDPRGLLTPHYDGWSVDSWVVGPARKELIPAREGECHQFLNRSDDIVVTTECRTSDSALRSAAAVVFVDDEVAVRLSIEAVVPERSLLAVSVRPYNPEGVSFVDTIEVTEGGTQWLVNTRDLLTFDRKPDTMVLSHYGAGDVYRRIEDLLRDHGGAEDPPDKTGGDSSIACPVGLASGAALFAPVDGAVEVTVTIPLKDEGSPSRSAGDSAPRRPDWSEALAGRALFELGDPHLDEITSAALRTVVLLSPLDIYPGPFTYRRFWFRDACLMINGLLAAGISAPAERCISRFELRQDGDGYLRSQEGEWDSNGIALWVIERFCGVMHRRPLEEWVGMIRRAADWIVMKRRETAGTGRHAGLLPAGFSAEHLGPNDFYFWDDFWGIGGLDAAAALFERVGHPALAGDYRAESRAFRHDLWRAIGETCRELGRRAIPASPYRRLDAGAIGSIVCGYPLRLVPTTDPALSGTIEYLYADCCLDDAFFQDMIHSGLNPYLSLQLAQVLRRMNDPRAARIFRRIGELATSTGQWPEAIHPATGGGCMGDGQHGWAAAEWLAYVRSMFVAEEGETLFLCSGICPHEVAHAGAMRAVGVRTTAGIVSVEVTACGADLEVHWSAQWYEAPPLVRIRFLGCPAVASGAAGGTVRIPITSDRFHSARGMP